MAIGLGLAMAEGASGGPLGGGGGVCIAALVEAAFRSDIPSGSNPELTAIAALAARPRGGVAVGVLGIGFDSVRLSDCLLFALDRLLLLCCGFVAGSCCGDRPA